MSLNIWRITRYENDSFESKKDDESPDEKEEVHNSKAEKTWRGGVRYW